jgi:uncharacterized SAM-binding protein YcdF (DUF218 family)
VFFVLSKLVDVLLSPLCWALFFFALAIPWRRRSARRGQRRRRAFGGLALAILLLFSTPVVANAITTYTESAAVTTYRADVVYDTVIVLGGMGDETIWKATGEPAWNDNVERILVAQRLLVEGKAKTAIVSGGPMNASYAEWSEARQLALQLRSSGIAEDRILLEDRARNTRENALYSAAIVRAHGFQRVLVITSAFHVPRAAACFRKVGLDVDWLPVDWRRETEALALGRVLPRASALAQSSGMLRELFGRLVYRLTGYA